jgi:site-specific recombinase XerD
MASIKVIGIKSKTGFFLHLRVIINRTPKLYSLKKKIEERNWDPANQRVKPTAPNSNYINNFIAGKIAEANKIISKLESEKGRVTYKNFVEHYGMVAIEKTNPNDFYDYYTKFVAKKQGTFSPATTTVYEITLGKLKTFSKKLMMADINFSFIQGFELFLKREQKLNATTTYKHVKTFKAVINNAVKEGYYSKNPIENYSIKKGTGNRQFLSESEVNRIIDLKLTNKGEANAQKMFVFQCFTGLRYTDLVNMSYENIHDTTLIFVSEKTNTQISIPIVDRVQQIIKELPKEGKFFNISNQKYNEHLKTIREKAKITKPVSSHIGRHTFATLALTKGIGIETVSSVLGHASLKTTQIYAKITDQKKQEDMKKLNF